MSEIERTQEQAERDVNTQTITEGFKKVVRIVRPREDKNIEVQYAISEPDQHIESTLPPSVFKTNNVVLRDDERSVAKQ
ncbi:MAG: hypothetical protein ACT4QA_14750 [Panacagrimonas sp.]